MDNIFNLNLKQLKKLYSQNKNNQIKSLVILERIHQLEDEIKKNKKIQNEQKYINHHLKQQMHIKHNNEKAKKKDLEKEREFEQMLNELDQEFELEKMLDEDDENSFDSLDQMHVPTRQKKTKKLKKDKINNNLQDRLNSDLMIRNKNFPKKKVFESPFFESDDYGFNE